MNDFFFLYPYGNFLSCVSTFTHTHTHIYTVTYFKIASFLTFKFGHLQNGILKSQKPLSIAGSIFTVSSDPLFLSFCSDYKVSTSSLLLYLKPCKHLPQCVLVIASSEQ